MKTASVLAVLVIAALALALPASSACAANYTPSTTIIVYVHGFDANGYTRVGVYGDDETDPGVLNVVNILSGILGQPTWQTNSTAANQICGCTYYGDTAPAWYTSTDIAEDAAAGLQVPRYALRVAKYIQHVLNRAPSATSVNICSGSFGTEVTRYLIEHNLLNLASNQKIVRWNPIVGVLRGNWAATNIADWLAEALGGDSPDIDDMRYSWVDANISGHDNMNTSLYGPMIINQFCADDDGDGYITALCNDANDGTNLVSDEKFGGYTTSAALHQATDGTLQMPGVTYQSVLHSDIVDSYGMWAGVAAASSNNKRVTTLLSRIKPLTRDDGYFGGSGEYVFKYTVTSPRANTLWGITAPIQVMDFNHGVSQLVSASRNETKYPNFNMFDQIVPSGETSLSVALEVWELDWFPWFYDMYELTTGTSQRGVFSGTVSTSSNGTVTFSNGNVQVDLATTIRNVY